MSRTFKLSDDTYLERSPLLTVKPFTVASWFKPVLALPPLDRAIWFQGNATGGYSFMLQIEGTSVPDRGTLRAVENENGVPARAQTSTLITAGIWQHGCGVFATNSDRRVFLDGGGKGTNATAHDAFLVAHTVLNIGVQNIAPLTRKMRGELGHVTIWSVALSDDEIASLGAGLHPLRMRGGDIVSYVPINGQDPEADPITQVTLSVNGSPIPAVAEEPQPLFGNSIVAPA